MPSILEMMESTRTRLGDPRSGRPGYAQLLQQVCSHTRRLLQQKRATSNPWNFAYLSIDVVSDEDIYQIQVSDFGTPLTVMTQSTNPNHIVRLVDFYCPQNLNFSWGLPQGYAAYAFPQYDGSFCTAQRVAFYWQDSNAFAQIQPIPKMSASYKIAYLRNASGVNAMPLTAEPLPAEDADVVELRSAQSLLSLTEWSDSSTADGRALNAERRKDLFVTLGKDEAEATRQFNAAQLITTGPRTTLRWTNVDG